jgi:hypothetical protein
LDERFQKADERKHERKRESGYGVCEETREREREYSCMGSRSIIIFLIRRLSRAKSGPNRSLYTPDWGGYQGQIFLKKNSITVEPV